MKYQVYVSSNSVAKSYFLHESEIIAEKSGLEVEQENKLKKEVSDFIKANEFITLTSGEKIQSKLIDSFEIRTGNISKIHIESKI